jgi:hypothetical protein
MIDPGWYTRRVKRIRARAAARAQRRVIDGMTLRQRDLACSHWRTCHHAYCIGARRSVQLTREAADLVQRLTPPHPED